MEITWLVRERIVSNSAKKAHVVSRQKQEVPKIEDISTTAPTGACLRNNITRLTRTDAQKRCYSGFANWERHEAHLKLRGDDARAEQR